MAELNVVGVGVIGVGIDAVDVERFRQVLARTPSLRHRVFTEAEIAYAHQANDPTERLAVRWAAKEATMKALGVGLGGFKMRDAEVTVAASGAPSMRLSGAALARLSAVGGTDLMVSMTHTATTAQAIVLAVCRPDPPAAGR